jgi:hypothetical protein
MSTRTDDEQSKNQSYLARENDQVDVLREDAPEESQRTPLSIRKSSGIGDLASDRMDLESRKIFLAGGPGALIEESSEVSGKQAEHLVLCTVENGWGRRM